MSSSPPPPYSEINFVAYYRPYTNLVKKDMTMVQEDSNVANDVANSRIVLYSTSKPLDEALRTRTKPNIIRHHKFHPQGFHLLGRSSPESSLATLQTLQSRLRDLTIRNRLKEREIKADICKSAMVLLEKAAKDIQQLEKKRKDALVFGEARLAKELAKQIRDIFDRALFATHIDLLLDNDEVKSFGIVSRWVGHKNNEVRGDPSSHSDLEDAERSWERTRGHKKRRSRRARSAILREMKQRYDITDLEIPKWHLSEKKKSNRKKQPENDEKTDDEEDEVSSDAKEAELKTDKKTASSQTDARLAQSMKDEAVGTEDAITIELIGPDRPSTQSNQPVQMPHYHRSISAPSATQQDAGPTDRGHLKDANAADGYAGGRRRSSSLPVDPMYNTSIVPMADKRRAGVIVEDAVERLQRLQRQSNDAPGVREAAKRFRKQMIGINRMETDRVGITQEGQEDEARQKADSTEELLSEAQQLRRVNFLLGNENQQTHQWKGNARHKGETDVKPNTEGQTTIFPELVKSSTNVCPYCEEREPWMASEEFLRLHLAERCPFLARCEFCDKVVEVHELNEHQLRRCPFVGKSLVDCWLCGLARYPDEPESHPKCRHAYPPTGGAWCPLCSALIRNADSKQEWLQHLRNECYNNPRSHQWNRTHHEADRPSQMLAELNENLAAIPSSHLEQPMRQRWTRPVPSGRSHFSLPSIVGPSGTTRSNALDVHHLRAAARRLNHERRVKAIQRNVRITHRDQDEQSSDSE